MLQQKTKVEKDEKQVQKEEEEEEEEEAGGFTNSWAITAALPLTESASTGHVDSGVSTPQQSKQQSPLSEAPAMPVSIFNTSLLACGSHTHV